MSNIIHIDKPVRSRSYHHWTTKELKVLDAKPDNVCWKEWLVQTGLFDKVKYKAAIHRYHRNKAEKRRHADPITLQ